MPRIPRPTPEARDEHRWSLRLLGEAVVKQRAGTVAIIPLHRAFFLLTP